MEERARFLESDPQWFFFFFILPTWQVTTVSHCGWFVCLFVCSGSKFQVSLNSISCASFLSLFLGHFFHWVVNLLSYRSSYINKISSINWKFCSQLVIYLFSSFLMCFPMKTVLLIAWSNVRISLSNLNNLTNCRYLSWDYIIFPD